MNTYSKGCSAMISVLLLVAIPSLLPSTSAALDCRKHVFAPQCRGIIAKRGSWARRSLPLPGDRSTVDVPPALAQLLEGDIEDDALYKAYDDLTYQETNPSKYAGGLATDEADQGPPLDGGELWVYSRPDIARLVNQRRLRNGVPAESRRGRHRPTRSPGELLRKVIGPPAAPASEI